MDQRGEAFVALPGGLGTLEEVLEALTLKQLGYHTKPIVVLDLDGYFDPLWTQIQRGIDEGFIKSEYLDLWYPAPDVDELGSISLPSRMWSFRCARAANS